MKVISYITSIWGAIESLSLETTGSDVVSAVTRIKDKERKKGDDVEVYYQYRVIVIDADTGNRHLFNKNYDTEAEAQTDHDAWVALIDQAKDKDRKLRPHLKAGLECRYTQNAFAGEDKAIIYGNWSFGVHDVVVDDELIIPEDMIL